MSHVNRRADRRGLLLSVLLSFLVSAPSSAQPPGEKTAVIREIIRVTGSEQLGSQMAAAMMGQLKQAYPQVPEEVWKEFTAALDPAEATALMIPVYSKHFTIGELRELLAFYSTPLGQKLIREMPAVMQESSEIGGAWGQRKMEDIIRRLAEKGFKPAEI